mgnify:CR=1 FL=1
MSNNAQSNTIAVLVVVDVEGALASGDLQDNVYLIDTNKHVGSGNEGQAELYTACNDSQVIQWTVTPVAPTSDVSITGFTGQMVSNQICVPQAYTDPNGAYWAGRIEARGTTGNQQYSIVLSLDGKSMTFDPFLVIS